MKFFPALLFPFFVLNTLAQGKYDYGKLEEIRGMSKVYVSADAGDREAIVSLIDGKSGLVVVPAIDGAEFYINFQRTSQNQVGFANMATGQMDVYLRQGDRLRAVWIKEETNGAFKNAVAKSLAKRFLKDLSKLKK